MLLEEKFQVQKPEIVYEGNQGDIFLAKNRQVYMRTKHIDICDHFLRDMVIKKDMDINYIISEENPADIMKRNFSESDHAKNAKRITEGELWEIVENGRENVKNNGVLDRFMDCESTKYSSHTLSNTTKQENRN